MQAGNTSQAIPEMDLSGQNNHSNVPMGQPAQPSQDPAQIQKDFEATKKSLEKIKTFILKKYKFIKVISVLPPQSIPFFIEEEEVPKETQDFTHLYMVIPDEKFKEIPKIKADMVKRLEALKKKYWLQIKVNSEVWENCMDQKFELTGAIAMSFPIYDDNFLASFRVAEIHKSLVVRKFEKYVVSYVIAGSLVRGDATKTSDVDVFVVINDTDVKRMPRLELKERLRSIIFQYIGEACAMAGIEKNLLNVQPYLLTDFWESVKDANPVIFTFIRDGVPLYDRGTFMPWKALLRMGKLKPSPESIDMFMSMGDQTVQRAKKTLLDVVINDVYWSVLTPSQALLMLYGSPPPTPKQVVSEMKRVFLTKEKMLEKKYINILERVVKFYKDYEHEKVKSVKGAEVDKFLADTESYLKRLKELREQIEKRTQEKTIEHIYKDVFDLLRSLFGRKAQDVLIEKFSKDMVKTGKFSPNHLKILKNIVDARTKFKKGKSNAHKVDQARKEASTLINDLMEFSQRKDLMQLERGRMILNYGKGKVAELLNFEGVSFLFKDNTIQKIIGKKVTKSDMKEVSKTIEAHKANERKSVGQDVLMVVQKQIGAFEIIL